MHWQLGVRSPSLRRCFATGPRIISRISLPGPLRQKQRWIQLERRRWTKRLTIQGAGSTAISKSKPTPVLSKNTQAARAPQLFGRLRRPKLSTHRPNSNNRVKCPISKVSKGPNRVRDKPEDRTDHSESSLRYRFRWASWWEVWYRYRRGSCPS